MQLELQEQQGMKPAQQPKWAGNLPGSWLLLFQSQAFDLQVGNVDGHGRIEVSWPVQLLALKSANS